MFLLKKDIESANSVYAIDSGIVFRSNNDSIRYFIVLKKLYKSHNEYQLGFGFTVLDLELDTMKSESVITKFEIAQEELEFFISRKHTHLQY